MKRYVSVVSLLAILVVLAVAGWWGYRLVWQSNFSDKQITYVYVDERRDFADLCRQLQDSAHCERIGDFKLLADKIGYPDVMLTGRYKVTPGMNNLTLLNTLRRGYQSATRVTFNNIRLLDDLATRMDEQLMFSKEDLLILLTDSLYCKELGFTPENVKALFIPNTYEMYWNIQPDRFVQRMKKEYDAFWTEGRLKKAAAIGLSPIEVATLASIVEEETAASDEYAMVAGLYINRLKSGMLLQADPTVKYALGDFSLRRVLYVHLEIDSPYNTYLYAGLPPAPLRIPSIKGLDSVLNYTKHNYLYMTAKDDFSGRHNFAVTLSEHNQNANRYRAELNRRNIR